ncbi:MAG: electron transport complex subunit RsxC [Planctomycetota bacterium]
MLKTFEGGVHPPDGKELSKGAAISDVPLPETLIIPLSQHIGAPAEAVVEVGDQVRRGQLIGKAGGFVSAPVHAPTSGTIKKVVETRTPIGMTCSALLLETDGEDLWLEGCNEERDTADLSGDELKTLIADAGIVGMGGATFPTHVKLSPPSEKPINTVILNGVECEPFLTADYRLMLESPRTIIEGMKLVMRTVHCTRGIIGIEANKPDCVALMQKTLTEIDTDGLDLRVEMLEVKYPQGAEKQLIAALLEREVPSGGLPMDVGVVVQNVGTAHAIYEACALNRPLTERITTVTGPGVDAPKNFRARIGTEAELLLELAEYDEHHTEKIIYGGPMMGFAHFDLSIPVGKGMSGIVALTDAQDFEYHNCIRCARCIESCPAGLVPMDLSNLIEAGHFGESLNCSILDCIECGVCTYICPARRPIVQWIKLAKAELARERARKAAKEQAERTAEKENAS